MKTKDALNKLDRIRWYVGTAALTGGFKASTLQFASAMLYSAEKSLTGKVTTKR